MICATMLRTLAAAAAILAGGLHAAGEARFGGKAELETLSGVYASASPEHWYGGFGTRRFTFDRGSWGLTFTHALDADMRMKTFQFRTLGPYRVQAASTTVAGAFEAVFFEDAKFVTLLTGDEAVIEAFGFARCGLKLNVEVDISKTGCAGWRPVAACREDHDLLAVDAKGLYFGVRPRDNDLCTADKRPTALLAPVTRQ